MTKVFWSVLAVLAVLIGLLWAGPFPFTVPRPLWQIERGEARLVSLTANDTKLIGRQGPAERDLTEFLANRGWQYKARYGAGIIYERNGEGMVVDVRFRRGYWWFDLNKAP